MAHLLAPKPLDPELPVFFNVDGHVGPPPSANASEDVLLVQFCFQILARASKINVSPELRAAAKAVPITGIIDPFTLNAIKEIQINIKKKSPGVTVDGIVSPAKGYLYSQGALWTIVRLNNAVQEEYMNIWPRIDNIPACPLPLKAMVKREVVGR